MVGLMHTTPCAPDTVTPRPGLSPGGPPPGRRAWATAPGIVDFSVRACGYENDGLIQRERMPWYHQGYTASDPGESTNSTGLVNLLGSGTPRPALHMRDVTIIEHVQGASNTRNQDPHATAYGTNDGTNVGRLSGNGVVHGLHSRIVGSAPATLRRTFVTPQQRPPRVNRLANSRNAGQSYSQTTIHQGG